MSNSLLYCMEASGCGLFEVISWRLSERTGEEHGKYGGDVGLASETRRGLALSLMNRGKCLLVSKFLFSSVV